MDLDCDPAMVLQDGRRLKNSSQNIPRASLKLQENSEEWLKLRHAFALVFKWVKELVPLLFKCFSIGFSMTYFFR